MPLKTSLYPMLMLIFMISMAIRASKARVPIPEDGRTTVSGLSVRKLASEILRSSTLRELTQKDTVRPVVVIYEGSQSDRRMINNQSEGVRWETVEYGDELPLTGEEETPEELLAKVNDAADGNFTLAFEDTGIIRLKDRRLGTEGAAWPLDLELAPEERHEYTLREAAELLEERYGMEEGELDPYALHLDERKIAPLGEGRTVRDLVSAILHEAATMSRSYPGFQIVPGRVDEETGLTGWGIDATMPAVQA